MISEKNVEWFNNSVMEESIEVDSLPDVGLVIDIDVVYDLMTQLEEAESTPQVVQLEDTPQQPKTAPVPSPKSYLHSCITKELNAIYVAKNSDYGDAFGETYKKLGIISAVTRITDKVNRLQSLSTGNEVKVLDEKIEDTVMDLANYAIMLLIEMRMDTVEDSLVEYTENGLRLKEVVEDSHSINAGGSSVAEMGIELNEALTAFDNIGSDWWSIAPEPS